MTNNEISKILYEMAVFYEMDGVQFKPRAYEKAAMAVESFGENVSDLYSKGGIKALIQIPSVGKGIAEHIEDLIKKGHFKEYEHLKKKVPVNVGELVAIEGVGPKMLKVLWQKLKIKTLKDLEKVARAGKIRGLSHFGEKSEKKILEGIEFLKQSGGRRILGFMMPEIRKLIETINSFPGVIKVEVAGSVRRRLETIGDIDMFAISKRPREVMDRFVKLPQVAEIHAHGPSKSRVHFKSGLDVDLRVVQEESFGAMLLHFTGSKAHNIALRKIAIKKGLKLNEYGLFRGKKMIAGKTEEEIYKALGFSYIEPEMREQTGEIEISKKKKLPKLIGYGDLKGDLQIQTTWTDGENTIEEMAEAAQDLGLEYIVITDHTKSLAMTGGADEKKLRRQMKAIDKINRKLKVESSPGRTPYKAEPSGYRPKAGQAKFKVLKGAEVNIMKDGTLDIDDKTLSELDVVGAAVHSHFTLSREEQTKRIIKTMENPNVDIIFHLTSRRIQHRKPINLDIDEVIKAAKRTGTILEIDAYPDRLDIKDEYIKKCVESGIKMSIDSDAHSVQHLKFLEFGIAQARRGWAEKSDIINAWPVDKMLKMLKG